MIVKVFKGVWFFSLLVSMSVVLYVYASLPETVQLSPTLVITRDALFYIMLAAFAIFNVLVFVIGSVFPAADEFFRAWSNGLVALLNLFLVVTIQFINLMNSGEKFDYSSIGFIIYGSVLLIVLWSAACPVYYLSRRLTNKPTV